MQTCFKLEGVWGVGNYIIFPSSWYSETTEHAQQSKGLVALCRVIQQGLALGTSLGKSELGVCKLENWKESLILKHNTHTAATFVNDLCLRQARKEFGDLCPHEGCWWQIVGLIMWEGEKCRRDELEISTSVMSERGAERVWNSAGVHFSEASTRCLEITRDVHGPPWAHTAPSPLCWSWYSHMELGFCDLGSKLPSDSSSNYYPVPQRCGGPAHISSLFLYEFTSWCFGGFISKWADDLYSLLQNYFSSKQFSYLGAVMSLYRPMEN